MPDVAVELRDNRRIDELLAEAAIDRRDIWLDEAKPETKIRIGDREDAAPRGASLGDRQAPDEQPQIFKARQGSFIRDLGARKNLIAFVWPAATALSAQ